MVSTRHAPTVLVVEDEPDIARLIATALESDGIHVISVARGDRALETIRVIAFQTVVLDLVLPGRSGLDILVEMKAHPQLRQVPVVVVSAVASHFAPLLRQGVAKVLTKPFEADDLVAAVRDALAKGAADKLAANDRRLDDSPAMLSWRQPLLDGN